MWEETDVWEVLLALPPDGRWMPGKCCYKDEIMSLLDEGSPFIEENEQPVDQVLGVEWQIRLTPIGMMVAVASSREAPSRVDIPLLNAPVEYHLQSAQGGNEFGAGSSMEE